MAQIRTLDHKLMDAIVDQFEATDTDPLDAIVALLFLAGVTSGRMEVDVKGSKLLDIFVAGFAAAIEDKIVVTHDATTSVN